MPYLRSSAPRRVLSAIFPKPPQSHEVCGFSIFYKGALVREYFGKELLKEFERTCREKVLWE